MVVYVLFLLLLESYVIFVIIQDRINAYKCIILVINNDIRDRDALWWGILVEEYIASELTIPLRWLLLFEHTLYTLFFLCKHTIFNVSVNMHTKSKLFTYYLTQRRKMIVPIIRSKIVKIVSRIKICMPVDFNTDPPQLFGPFPMTHKQHTN